MKSKKSFKPGDLVEWCGARGVVTRLDFDKHLSVRVKFDDNSGWYFTIDGRACDWHKTPSLVLVSRPKKMVTKTVEKWINIYPNHAGGFYSDEKNADEYAQQNRIACVKLTGEYEVEVDDE